MAGSGEGHAHLVVPRFDRPCRTPLHQHTLGGLLHVDYNHVGASSYEEYLRTILRLGMPPAAAAAEVVDGLAELVARWPACAAGTGVPREVTSGPPGRWKERRREVG